MNLIDYFCINFIAFACFPEIERFKRAVGCRLELKCLIYSFQLNKFCGTLEWNFFSPVSRNVFAVHGVDRRNAFNDKVLNISYYVFLHTRIASKSFTCCGFSNGESQRRKLA